MLKKLFLAAILLAPVSLFAQSKVGSVRAQEIYNLMPEKAAAEKTLGEVSKKYETEGKALQDEFQKKLGEYQNLAKDTPESIKTRREQELQELSQKIQNFQQVAGEDLQRQQQVLNAPIEQKISDAIQAVGKENGYTYIMQMPNPLFPYVGSDVIDVTDLVKKKLNLSDKPAAAAAPAAKAAATPAKKK